MRRMNLLAGLALVAAAFAVAPGTAAAATEGPGIELGPHVFGDLRARNIGPAVMSGRISALDVVASAPRHIWVGAAGGGVWKSSNAGVNFEPVFDDHNQCIGALTIDQARPDTVWVGTGEPWVRNSVSVGDGVYRTVDGGDTWRRMGLEDSERVARIVIHPDDPAVVYVAAMGHLWSANETRGLYRTSDGGATWDRVLYVDDGAGCVDVALDPQNPDVVYAAMWQFRRTPHSFHSGGPGSGLYKSEDGGATWRELRNGLPEGDLGRIAVAVPPTRPETVYATIEAAESALYRSDDRGETWRLATTHEAVKGRPFYFSLLVPDPQDPDRVYRPGTSLMYTRDGGRTIEGMGGAVHPDHHALWIDPNDPSHMLSGTDGGVYETRSRGMGWRHMGNLPVSQFYRVAVDDRQPFWVYGGLQDNGSWRAPSRKPGGIANGDWENLGGGDGFAVAVDRTDPDLVYWEWQGGNVSRKDLRTGENKDIKPLPEPGDPEYRWNWNTPLAQSPTVPERLYIGSQFLHRSTDGGDTWTKISPDLTTDDPARQRQADSGGLTIDNTTAENHCTIFAIAESPRDRKVIWVGTDDGRLQVTDDDGKSWRDVTDALPGLPADTWISCVEASWFDRETAFVTADGHRHGDKTPYVFVTRDLGRTWSALATDDITGYCHVVRQDPVNADLLYLGAEDGLYLTLDGGLHWARYEAGLPRASVRDMVIQQRASSLVIGTHGRGIWLIDDLTPLRELTARAMVEPFALLSSRPAVLRPLQWGQGFSGDDHYAAGNPPSDALIIYHLAKRHMFGPLKIEIYDGDGELLKTLDGGKRKGLNVVPWSPSLRPPKVAPSPVLDPVTTFAAAFGPAAPEGEYTFRVIRGKETYEGKVGVTYAAESPHEAADRKAQAALVRELYDMLADLAYVCDATAELREGLTARADGLADGDALRGRLEEHEAELHGFQGGLMAIREVQGISGEKQLRERLVRLYAGVASYGGRPTRSQEQNLEKLRGEIAAAGARFGELTGDPLAELNASLEAAGQAPVVLLTREEHAARD